MPNKHVDAKSLQETPAETATRIATTRTRTISCLASSPESLSFYHAVLLGDLAVAYSDR